MGSLQMSIKGPPSYKGRTLGIVTLVTAQSIIGFIHVVSGFWLLLAVNTGSLFSSSGMIYSVYTIMFGLLTIVFAAGLWLKANWGWIGTFAVALFVIIADSLTLLNLPSVPGIPKFAGVGEISYSLIVIVYSLQRHIRTEYGITHDVE